MTLSDLIDVLRRQMLRDYAEPSLWSDPELTRHLNEAQVLFARHTHILRDDEPPVAEIVTEPGVARYELDPAVIHVVDVWDDTGRSLRPLSRKDLPRMPGNGRPRAFTADAGAHQLRVAPPPDEAYTLNMLVARKPLDPLEEPEDEPEIPEEYHADLCLYAAWKALMNNGPEGSDQASADQFHAEWKLRLRDVKREVYHLRAGTATRVMPNPANR